MFYCFTQFYLFVNFYFSYVELSNCPFSVWKLNDSKDIYFILCHYYEYYSSFALYLYLQWCWHKSDKLCAKQTFQHDLSPCCYKTSWGDKTCRQNIKFDMSVTKHAKVEKEVQQHMSWVIQWPIEHSLASVGQIPTQKTVN